MTERTCTACGGVIPARGQFCTHCGTVAPAVNNTDVTHTFPAGETSPPAAPPPRPTPSWQDQTTVSVPPQSAPVGWPGAPPPSAPSAPPPYPYQGQVPPGQPYGPPPQWQPQPPPQWAPASELSPLHPPASGGGNVLSAVLAFLGGVLLVVGALTPWVRTSVDTFSGWTASPDAKIVIGLAVVAVVVAIVLLAGIHAVVLRLALVAVSVAALVITVVNILTVDSRIPEELNPAIGIGLILMPMGAVLLLASAALTTSART